MTGVFAPAWLTEHNSYRVVAWAEACSFPKTADELIAALQESVGVRTVLLGHGCNVLLSRNHYDASVRFVSTRHVATPVAVADDLVKAAAGTRLRDVCRIAAKAGLSGLEHLWDIPGSIGGAASMNAGAYGVSLYDVVESVEVFWPGTGEISVFSREQCRPTYRMTTFQGTDAVILSVTLRLSPAAPAAILREMGRIGKLRRSKLPYNLPSAGSVFRRPEGAPPVGQIMEEAGLKGFQIGGAQISPRHAGIIVNAGAATGADILAVIEEMRQAARERYGVELVLEQVVV